MTAFLKASIDIQKFQAKFIQEEVNLKSQTSFERVSEFSTCVLESDMTLEQKISSTTDFESCSPNIQSFKATPLLKNKKFIEQLDVSTPNSSSSWSQNKRQFIDKKQLTLDLGSSLIIKERKKTSFMLQSQTAMIQVQKAYEQEEIQDNEIVLTNKDINEDYYQKKYEELEELGRGFQAMVKKVSLRITNQIFAAKIFVHLDDEELKENIRNEYMILKSINNKYIVKVYELIETQKCSIIIMEYIDGVCLQDLKYKVLTDNEKLSITKKLIKIIKYIHSLNIIHRDLSSKNVLWDATNNQLKLIDFGIAKQIVNKEINFTPCGDTAWQAPEQIKGLGYNEKVDIWQVGCICYELFEKVEQIKSIHIIKKVKKNILKFENTSENIQPIILKMLEVNSQSRISAEECLSLLKLLKK